MKPYPITCPLLGQTKPLPFTVDGHTHKNSDSPLDFDGKYPPFYVFDQNNQTNISGPHKTRAKAQTVRRSLSKKHGVPIR